MWFARTLTLLGCLALGCTASSTALAHGDLHERIESVTYQLAGDTGNASLWIERADLRRQHGEFAGALQDVAQAGRLKPDWPPVALQRARILYDSGDFRGARTAAMECLCFDPANADALVISARSNAKLGDLARAIENYTRVLSATNRPLPDLYLERARAQAQIGDFTAAAAGMDEGMKRLGETPSLVLPAIQYDCERKSYDSALERIGRARKYLGEVESSLLAGEVLARAGRIAAARAEYESAIAGLKVHSGPQQDRLEARVRAALDRLPAQ